MNACVYMRIDSLIFSKMKTAKIKDVSRICVEATLSSDGHYRSNTLSPNLHLEFVELNQNGRVLGLAEKRVNAGLIMRESITRESIDGRKLNAIIHIDRLHSSVARVGVIIRAAEGCVLRTDSMTISFSIFSEDPSKVQSDEIKFADGISLADYDAEVDWFCFGILSLQRSESGRIEKAFFKDISSFPLHSGDIANQMEDLAQTLSDDIGLLERGLPGWYGLRSTCDTLLSGNVCELCEMREVECETLKGHLLDAEDVIKSRDKHIKLLTDTNKLMDEKMEQQKVVIDSLKSELRQRDLVAKLTDDSSFAAFHSHKLENDGEGVGSKMRYQESLIMSIKEELLGLSNRIVKINP